MRKIHHFRRDMARDVAMQPLFDELGSTRSNLECAYARFNASTEPELIEACVFEINAAQARYNYLLRLIKEAGGEAAFKTLSGSEAGVWA
jgi:hypothetical protein